MGNEITLKDAKRLKRYADSNPDLEREHPLQFFNLQMAILLGTMGSTTFRETIQKMNNIPEAYIYVDINTNKAIESTFCGDKVYSFSELTNYVKRGIDIRHRPDLQNDDKLDQVLEFADGTIYKLESFRHASDCVEKYSLKTKYLRR